MLLKLKTILNKNRESYSLDLFLVFYSLLIPWGHALQNIGLVLLGVYWIISLKRSKRITRNQILNVILFSSFFFIQGFSLFYTENLSRGIELLVRQLPLLLIPLFLLTGRGNCEIKKSIVYKSILAFSFSLLIVVLINLINVLIKSQFNFNEISKLPGKEFAFGIVNYHYLYLAYYISVSIVLLLWYLLNGVKKDRKGLVFTYSIYICILFFFFTLVLLGGRMSLLITGILTIIILTAHFYKKKKTYLIVFSAFIIGSSLLVYKMDLPIVEKTKELINYKGQYSDIKKKWGGKMMRVEIWNCARELISQKPVLGYGIGSVQNHLTGCLKETSEYPILYTGKYTFNAHNQFFQYWLNSGIIGLFAFLTFISLSLRKAYFQRNIFYILFIVISILTFMTESILERNHGIVFFAFLCNLFYSMKYKKSI